MPRRHRKARSSRRRLASLAGVVGLVAAVSPLYLVTPAQAATAPPGNYFTVVDTGGANDEVGQNDLTQFGRDDSDPSTYNLFWSWDDASWSGGNTGDACAQFDSNGDGNIDYAVCVEVGQGAGTTVVQTAGSPTSWTCDDSKADRCAGPTSDASGATVGTLFGFDTSATADLTTATDPFAAGSDAPDDTSVQVHIPKASLPAGATLVNVCSFPSIGNGGNDDPKDCVLNPGSGFLVIHKFSANDNSTVFPFTVNPGNTTVDVTGNSDSTAQALVAGSTYSIAESVPNGWIFVDAFCHLASFRSTGNVTGSGVSDITIEPGQTTTCDVEDDPQSPDLALTKTASPRTYTAANQDVTYTLTATNSGNTPLFDVKISDPMLGGDLTDCTDPGGNAVDPTSTSVNLDVGQSLTCTGLYTTTAADVTAGKVVNTATAEGFEHEEDRIFRTATATITLFVPPPPPPPPPPGSPALAVTKTSVPPSGSVVEPGAQIVYTLSYDNTGTAAASGVVLSDTLPADLDYTTGSASNGGTYDTGTRTLSWSLGSLAAGSNGLVTFTAQVAQTATDGEQLHNVGVLTAPGITDPSNSDDIGVTLPPPPPPPTGAVTISKAVDKDVAQFGDTLTYSVTVGATGNKDQTHVVASDTVPAGTTYVDGSATCEAPCAASESNDVITWNVGTLAPDTTATGTFQVTIDTPTPGANGGIPAERISNVAQVTFDADPTELSNKVTTDVTAVLGEKVSRPPTKTPPLAQHEPSVLPFTGLALPYQLSLLQLLTMATAALACGSVLVRRARVRPVAAPVAVVQWRDQ